MTIDRPDADVGAAVADTESEIGIAAVELDPVELSGLGSFPASDPPSSWAGTTTG